MGCASLGSALKKRLKSSCSIVCCLIFSLIAGVAMAVRFSVSRGAGTHDFRFPRGPVQGPGPLRSKVFRDDRGLPRAEKAAAGPGPARSGGRQSVADDALHGLAETLELGEPRVDRGRDPQPLELRVQDRDREDSFLVPEVVVQLGRADALDLEQRVAARAPGPA